MALFLMWWDCKVHPDPKTTGRYKKSFMPLHEANGYETITYEMIHDSKSPMYRKCRRDVQESKLCLSAMKKTFWVDITYFRTKRGNSFVTGGVSLATSARFSASSLQKRIHLQTSYLQREKTWKFCHAFSWIQGNDGRHALRFVQNL